MNFEPYRIEKRPLAEFSIPADDSASFSAEARERLKSLPVPIVVCRDLPEDADHPEGFAIAYSRAAAVLYAGTDSTLLWACDTLLAADSVPQDDTYLWIVDYPDCPIRGYRVFLPSRAHFDEFFRMVDLMARLRLNTIILEIGGAMEYVKHPEINRAWDEFAKDMHRYSGRTHEIQNGFAWDKNSIHVDNAEGDILTGSEVRRLIDYCHLRGIRVIPEVPTLSHADYICLAHPEIRERADDPYPDTYCPSDPRSYEIVFDVLTEVLEVFHDSEYVHIGHDECYSLAVCPQCAGKDPVDLYTQDIVRIHDFLAARGKKTIMWGEKLLNARTDDGYLIGGGKPPLLYRCAEKLPRDITMLHWYWSFNEDYDKVYHTNGYPVLFGNFDACCCKHYRQRADAGIKGGFVSNWGSFAPEYMQRNKQYIMLIFSALAFWSHTYDSPDRDRFYEKALNLSYGLWKSSLADPLEILHTTDAYLPSKSYYDGVFVVDSECLLGHYELTYPDGTKAQLPVKYGFQIANDGSNPDFRTGPAGSDYREISHAAIPVEKDHRIWYRAAYENPRPGLSPAEIRFIPSDIAAEPFQVRFEQV